MTCGEQASTSGQCSQSARVQGQWQTARAYLAPQIAVGVANLLSHLIRALRTQKVQPHRRRRLVVAVVVDDGRIPGFEHVLQ